MLKWTPEVRSGTLQVFVTDAMAEAGVKAYLEWDRSDDYWIENLATSVFLAMLEASRSPQSEDTASAPSRLAVSLPTEPTKEMIKAAEAWVRDFSDECSCEWIVEDVLRVGLCAFHQSQEERQGLA